MQYLIDAANRRVGKRVNGVTTQRLLYSGGLKPVAELDSTGSVVTRYVFATHENVPEYMVRGGVVYRFVLDHLGSVRLVVNSQMGEIAQRLDYDDFGNVLFDSKPGFQPFGYAGGLYDQHHMDYFGYGTVKPTLDEERTTSFYIPSATGGTMSDAYAAIRGREQDLITTNGGPRSAKCGNSINGISIFNPNWAIYMSMSLAYFGPAPEFK